MPLGGSSKQNVVDPGTRPILRVLGNPDALGYLIRGGESDAMDCQILLKGRTVVKKSYHTIGKQGKVNEQELAAYLAKQGQFLLPMVDLIEQSQMACDELIDVTGRATIQAVLQLSAMEAAGGPPQQGKRRSSEVVFYGRQPGRSAANSRLQKLMAFP
jgi:hypothetical protein